MIASSSLKDDLFLVNFQMKKATIPRTARPPATDIPTIAPKPRPGSSSPPSLLLAAVSDGFVDGVGVFVPVLVTVTTTPFSSVLVTILVVGVSAGGGVGGGVGVVGGVGVFFEVSVGGFVGVDGPEVGGVDVSPGLVVDCPGVVDD